MMANFIVYLLVGVKIIKIYLNEIYYRKLGSIFCFVYIQVLCGYDTRMKIPLGLPTTNPTSASARF